MPAMPVLLATIAIEVIASTVSAMTVTTITLQMVLPQVSLNLDVELMLQPPVSVVNNILYNIYNLVGVREFFHACGYDIFTSRNQSHPFARQ